MAIYFTFSDEAGDYKKDRTDRFIACHPFYCRSVIVLNAYNWKILRDAFYSLKYDLLNLEPTKEVKWSYIWSIASHKRNNQPISSSKPYYFLRNYSVDELVNFLDKSLELLGHFEDCALVFTITFNDRNRTQRISEKNILKMHLQDIMQ